MLQERECGYTGWLCPRSQVSPWDCHQVWVLGFHAGKNSRLSHIKEKEGLFWEICTPQTECAPSHKARDPRVRGCQFLQLQVISQAYKWDNYSHKRIILAKVAQMVKNLPAMQETQVQSPGLGRSPREGNGYPLQYSCLENPMEEETGGLQFMESQRIRHH